MIVVLDSNVWVSALHFKGAPLAALRKAFVADRIACCAEIQAEVQQTLVKKLNWQSATAAIVMNPLLEDAVLVHLPADLPKICRDPKDDIILACARIAQAELIVTGDKDLLTLASYLSIRILTTRDYLNLPASETHP